MKKMIAVLGLCFCCVEPVLAADDGYTLRADQKMSAVLRDFSGKRVTVHLRAGGELTGKVAVVGDHALQISSLANKDFYDAIIAIDAIEAIEVKVR